MGNDNTGELKMKELPVLSMPTLDFEIPCEFFYGASKGYLLTCGVNVVLHLNQNHYVHIHYALGDGTNKTIGFISLWTILVWFYI